MPGDSFPSLSNAAETPMAGPSTVRRQRVESFPRLGDARTPPPPASQTTQSTLPPEVSSKHVAVLEKASRLLNNDTDKLAQFKAQVSSYRHSESTATELIDTLWDIFNVKLDEFGKLITSTADLFDYDAKNKRTDLLGAWNDWKIQMQTADSAASNGYMPQPSQRSRILLVKSSAKGRQIASTQSVWNRIEAVAASRPVPSSSITQRIGAMNLNSATRPTVPWTGSSTSRAPPPPVIRPSQPVVRKSLAEEFPSLPVKERERIHLNAAAAPARQVVSWNAGTSSTPQSAPVAAENGKGKGKKKGKKVLFHVG